MIRNRKTTKENKQSMQRKLECTRKEISDLNKVKSLLQEEKPQWKKHTAINFQTDKRINTILEHIELSYPWFPSLEKDKVYDTLSYLHPYTISFFLVYNRRQPYQVYLSISFDVKTKTKYFKSRDKALKYIEKLKTQSENMFKRKCKRLDKTIVIKDKQLSSIQKTYTSYFTTT
ncbi:hypothetical protein U8V72_20410 [Priestia filamentosa]|uniref:hypothetical protein n=1 Tax=Priestia filamentosa TaxID=1402861 RepID=UPI00397C56A0